MTINLLVDEILGQVRGIARDVLQREGVRIRTASVVSTSPLRILYDGEDTSSVVTPRTTVATQAGDRVVVAKSRGQATILGVLGTPVEPPWISIPLSSGWNPRTSGGYYPGLRIRRVGDRLEINAAVRDGGLQTTVGVIPDGMGLRPKYDSFLPSTGGSEGGVGQCHVSRHGGITHSYGIESPGFLGVNGSVPLT